MYQFYLKQGDKQVLLPVAPSSVQTQVGSPSKKISLVEMGDASILGSIGLRNYRFKILLPGRAYSFVQSEGSFQPPIYYLNILREFKATKKPMQLIIFRKQLKGEPLFQGNVEVSLEEYTISENSGEEGDFWVDLHFLEYRKIQSTPYKAATQNGMTVLVPQGQERTQKAIAKTYTVRAGDTLWGIAKRELNDGSKFTVLAKKNNIGDPNKIYPGQVLYLEG